MPMRPTRLLAAAVLGALALTGCSGDGDEPDTKATSGVSATAASTAAPTGGAGAGPDAEAQALEAAKAGIDPANPPKPIASSTTAAVVDGDPKATMKIDLLGLKRQGKTVLASYGFTVNAAAGASDDPQWIYDYLGNQGWNPALIDSTNLTLHRVVTAAKRPLQTAYQGVKFRPGQTLYAYAVFAAPPEGVTTMDAVLSDSVPAVPGVALS